MRQLFTCFGFALGAGALVGCGNGADADGKGDLLLPAPTSVDGMQGSEQALPPAQGPGGVAQNGTAAPGVPAPAGTQFADPAAFAPAPGAVGGIVADDVENSGASSVPEPVGPNFDAVGTNPFVFTLHDPLSTFAADVDTASYDVFRKDVGAGQLPPPDSVRLEEFVNFFDYDYPAPSKDDEQPFSISLAAAPHFVDGGTTLFRVGIQGKVLDDDGRKAMNLVFLIDTSGSMRSADKLPLVQRLLVDSLHLLSPADTVSIVTYAGSTAVALPATEASERDTIKQAINSLAAAGSTAGAGGIQLAYAEAEAGFVQGGVNHVILCTDGDFNVGTSDTDALVDLIEKEREGGVTFTALGFGSDNLNDAMMEAISNAGNGTYAVITDEQHAHDYVTDKLFSSLQFIAKDMKLQVEFNPEHVLAYRLLGYENRAIADQDFRVDTVDAGEIGSGHRVTALYELVLAGDELPNAPNAPEPEDGAEYEEPLEVQAEDLALVKVRYKDVDADADSPAYEVNQALAADAVAEDPDALDADFRWAVAIASFAELLKESPYANASWLPAIADEFDTQKGRDDARARFTELFTKARPLITLPERPQPVRDAGVAEPIVPDAEAAPVGQDAGDDDFGADAGVDAAAP